MSIGFYLDMIIHLYYLHLHFIACPPFVFSLALLQNLFSNVFASLLAFLVCIWLVFPESAYKKR